MRLFFSIELKESLPLSNPLMKLKFSIKGLGFSINKLVIFSFFIFVLMFKLKSFLLFNFALIKPLLTILFFILKLPFKSFK